MIEHRLAPNFRGES